MSRLPPHTLKRYLDRPDAELDLHGLTRIEAESELRSFLDEATSLNWTKVRIITGQGRNSASGEAVLRNWAEGYLDSRGLRHQRAGYGQGGDGALDVFLRGRF